jgi:hypothetical protein
VSIVERIVTVYNDKGSKQAVKDLKKLEKNFIDAGKKIGKAFAVATVAVGAFAVKVGVDAVKGAMEDQKQQAALATALRNTTGATDEAIAATTAYLDKLELLVAVDNNQLIPSLQILTQATKDVTQAQALQSLALDISAGTSKDLTSVSLALARALGGNVGALTRLGVPLDANAVKAKDLNAILTSLGETFAGQAEKRAATFEFRMIKLQLAFNQIIDQIGYALIPVLEEFAEYIVQNVLPAIQEFVNTNKDELAKGLKDVGTTLVTVGKSLAGFFKTISDNLVFIKAFAAIFIGAKLASGIYAIVTAIGVLRAAFVGQAAAATAAGTATAFATGGASAIAAAAAIGTFVAASGAAFIAINKMTAATDKGSKSTVQYNSHLKDLAKVAEQVAATNLKNNKIVIANTKVTKDLTAAEKKAAEMRAAIKKAGLDVFGIKAVSDTDPIQLEAARLNLIKQGSLEELKKVEALMKSAEAQMKVNENAQKYADILVALADNKISPEEIGILAAKWGLTVPAVTNYLATLLIVKDQKIDDSEVALLAAAWGISKEAAQKYLDFFTALNDGKLSDEEIKNLQDKWGLTYKEVQQYADFISKLDDFTLSDEEIKKLQDRWGLTTAEVLKYTNQIGIPVSYSGTLVSPADAATAGWNKANAALTAYIVGLNTAITQSAAAQAAAAAAFDATARAVAGAQTASAAAAQVTADSAAAAAKITSDAAANAAQVTADATAAAAAIAAESAALAEAIVEAAEAAAALADSLGGLTDDEIKDALAPDGVAGGAVEELPPGINANRGDLIALANGGIVTSPTMALIGEAGPEAVIPLSGSGIGGNITINITNAGSVIAEADLVSSIRNALLQGQNNGQVITKSAVAI